MTLHGQEWVDIKQDCFVHKLWSWKQVRLQLNQIKQHGWLEKKDRHSTILANLFRRFSNIDVQQWNLLQFWLIDALSNGAISAK